MAWQTPTATASWPMATCRKPGRSPARNRSSTFSSKRRMSSISRRKSRSISSVTARFFSTLAIARAVYVVRDEPRRAVEGAWIRVARRVVESRDPARGARCGDGVARRVAARTGAAVPAGADGASLRLRARRHRDRAGRRDAPPEAARRRENRRQADSRRLAAAGRSPRARRLLARRVLGSRAVVAAPRLERPARGDRAPVDRLHRARRRALYPDESTACRRSRRAAFPRRPQGRLRRLPGDGAPLLRALRRGGHPRLGCGPPRPLRHEPRGHAGPRLARRRRDGLMADPVSWLLIEPGWKVVDG